MNIDEVAFQFDYIREMCNNALFFVFRRAYLFPW